MTIPTKKRKLNFVSEFFYPANNAPGARFKPLVDEFIAGNFEVTVYTSNISAQLKEYSLKANIIGFPSNQSSNWKRLIQELLFGCETFIRLAFSKGEVYYITSPSFINCILAFSYCRIFHKKYILDIRDDYPRVYFDSGLLNDKLVLGKVLLWLEKKLYQHSFMLIAATNGLKLNIEKQYNGNVFLLRNGYSEKIFFPSHEKYEQFTLVFHGIISKYQDIDLLIELGQLIDYKGLPFKILVIGFGNQDYKLKGAIPHCIKYLGAQPYFKIPNLISRAHVGISFRKPGKISEDSFPVKIYEYLGVALPTIITPISEAGYYVASQQIGFQFEPEQKELILEKIIEISQNHELYEMLQSNLIGVRDQFSREKNSKGLVEYIQSKLKSLN